ncbi:MAG TPA: TetR/AcrR family transcriptional regulator [Spirochaetota bacterium]|nr:TetR/AcrR family transcriptional regulator [Spirochaetota bacterium]
MPTKGELTKQRIYECAEKVFSQKGYYQAQVSDISNMAHIAKGTIYQYFETKEQLFVSLIEKYVNEWEKEVGLNLGDFVGSGDSQDYARAYLRHRMGKTIAFFLRNEDRTKIILRMSLGVNEVIEQVIGIFEDSVLKAIINDIKLGKKFGHINPDLNEELRANGLLGGIMRVAYFYFVMKKESFSNQDIGSFTNEAILFTQNCFNMFQSEK